VTLEVVFDGEFTPPVRSTVPSLRSVPVPAHRAEFITPAEEKALVTGLYSSAEFIGRPDAFEPPAMSTEPFGRVIALCKARGVLSDFAVGQKPLMVKACETAEALPALATNV
jgi:hypothetical protein